MAFRTVYRSRYQSPVGIIEVCATNYAVQSVTLLDDRQALLPLSENSVTKAAVAQLDEYFAGKRREFDIPLLINDTPFRKMMWEIIGKIPYGTRISCEQLVSSVGLPNSARAAGTAVTKNQFFIFIPCHRVIVEGKNSYISNGEVTEYLIKHEATHITKGNK